MSYNKYLIDDGYYSHLVENCDFESIYEIPVIKAKKEILIPNELTPFDKRNRNINMDNFIHFYIFDYTFRQILNSPDRYLKQLKCFKGVITPDFSLYRNMPFTLQITNTYFNRAVGAYLQSHGMYVIPNIRWSDERTYLPYNGEEPLAFIGAPKNYIVSISTHVCIKSKEDRKYFKEGLRAMIDYLSPEVVIVYGRMPSDIFDEFKDKTKFINYISYIESKHK